MELGNIIFNYEQKKEDAKAASSLKDSILKHITDNGMAPLYSNLCEKYSWTVDETLLNDMKKKNETELASIEGKITEAGTNAGDTEVNNDFSLSNSSG